MPPRSPASGSRDASDARNYSRPIVIADHGSTSSTPGARAELLVTYSVTYASRFPRAFKGRRVPSRSLKMGRALAEAREVARGFRARIDPLRKPLLYPLSYGG